MNTKFNITVDQKNNILKVIVNGFWTEEDAIAYDKEFRKKAKGLIGRQWFVLADISNYAPQKKEVQEYHSNLMKFANGNGMKKAANLVGKTLTKMQIEKLSENSGLPLFSFFQDEEKAIKWLLEK